MAMTQSRVDARRLPSRTCILMGAALGSILLLAPRPVLAQSVGSVDVEVSASVPERCGFDPVAVSAASTTVQDLEAATTFAFKLKVDCNTPFAMGVVATNGRLVNATASGLGGYATTKAYGVQVRLDTDLGPVESGRCASTDLVAGGLCAFASDQAGRGLESGEGVAVGRDATVTIDWSSQADQPNRLAAGGYQDTLTFTLGARA